LQNITNAKTFKAAKLKLGIRSRRDAFGRGGEWVWELPPRPDTTMVETAVDDVPKVPVSVIYAEGHSRPDCALKTPPAVVYDEDHSRPNQRDRSADFRLVEGMDGDRVPLEWFKGIACLDPARAPREVPPHRWRQLVSDSTEFLVSSEKWAERAAVVGWTATDLFGCHRQRPVDHLGSAGLGTSPVASSKN
jgi:hypothetical protein